MATQKEVDDAIGHLKDSQGKIGKKHQRQHQEGIEESDAIRHALEHACCGQCEHLTITTYPRYGHTQVILRCVRGFSPTGLWRGWDPCADQPDCTSFSQHPSNVVFEGESQ